jgi:hypothetical protein
VFDGRLERESVIAMNKKGNIAWNKVGEMI